MGIRNSKPAISRASTTQVFEARLNELEDRLAEKETKLIELRKIEPRKLDSARVWIYSAGALSCALVLVAFFICKTFRIPFLWHAVDSRDLLLIKSASSLSQSDIDDESSFEIFSKKDEISGHRRPQPQGATSRLMKLISSGISPQITASMLCIFILITSHFLSMLVKGRRRAYFERRRKELESEIENIRNEARLKAEELRNITQFERARELIARLENVAVPGFTNRLLDLARRVANGQSETQPVMQQVSPGLSSKVGKFFGRLFDRIVAPVDYESQCAIICRACGQHNGLVPPLEYPGLTYRCCACGAQNLNAMMDNSQVPSRPDSSWDIGQQQENTCDTPHAFSLSTVNALSTSMGSSDNSIASSLPETEASKSSSNSGSNSESESLKNISAKAKKKTA